MRPKSKLVLSVGYWYGAHTLGLVLHPYQSMRRIVREKLFEPLTLLPLVTLFWWWVAGLLVVRFNVLLTLKLDFLANLIDSFGGKTQVFYFVFVWVGVYLLLWQLLLSYLYWRFKKVIG